MINPSAAYLYVTAVRTGRPTHRCFLCLLDALHVVHVPTTKHCGRLETHCRRTHNADHDHSTTRITIATTVSTMVEILLYQLEMGWKLCFSAHLTSYHSRSVAYMWWCSPIAMAIHVMHSSWCAMLMAVHICDPKLFKAVAMAIHNNIMVHCFTCTADCMPVSTSWGMHHMNLHGNRTTLQYICHTPWMVKG